MYPSHKVKYVGSMENVPEHHVMRLFCAKKLDGWFPMLFLSESEYLSKWAYANMS